MEMGVFRAGVLGLLALFFFLLCLAWAGGGGRVRRLGDWDRASEQMDSRTEAASCRQAIKMEQEKGEKR